MHTISEKAIWFRHPDYDPDRAQKLISLSMSRHLSTCKMSSKSIIIIIIIFFNNKLTSATSTQYRQ